MLYTGFFKMFPMVGKGLKWLVGEHKVLVWVNLQCTLEPLTK